MSFKLERNDESSSDGETKYEVDMKDSEREKIREKVSTLSFEDLLKMKEQIGLKLYNETVFGTSKKKAEKDFKRANKNRPREMSSKIKRFKRKLNSDVAPVPEKIIARDPRFDSLCGQFDDKMFKSNYNFINEVRQREATQLETELKSCIDPRKKESIRLLLQRTNNQLREQRKRDVENKKEYEEKREIKEKLKKGEKPVFKRKSVKKLESLIEQYEELKKTNKLQKHIERRTKKLTSKERRKMKN